LKEIKAFRGGKKKDYSREPTPAIGAPPMPSTLSMLAVERWQYYTQILCDMGVLAECDGVALGRLCEVSSQVIQLQDFINRFGYFDEIEFNGNVMRKLRPEVSLLDIADKKLIVLMREFGLTPSARSKVQTIPNVPGKKSQEDSYFI